MTEQQTPSAKLPYVVPMLKTFGSLTQMTTTVGNMGLRDGGTMNMAKTR